MRISWKTVLLGLAVILATPLERAGAADAFVPGTADVPLAPGLDIVADSLTVFDAPNGRLVEVYARIDGNRGDVRTFYADVLPALGWRYDAGVWVREKEQLDIGIEGATVRFALRPVPRAD